MGTCTFTGPSYNVYLIVVQILRLTIFQYIYFCNTIVSDHSSRRCGLIGGVGVLFWKYFLFVEMVFDRSQSALNHHD